LQDSVSLPWSISFGEGDAQHSANLKLIGDIITVSYRYKFLDFQRFSNHQSR